MAYRDPELSRMAGELLQEKTKVLILEEENSRLKAMLKAEVDDEAIHDEDDLGPPSHPAGLLSFWRNVSCNWIGNHAYLVEADEPTIFHAIKQVQKVYEVDGTVRNPSFGREEFFKLCSVSCKHCGRMEKEPHKQLRDTSLGTFFDIVDAFNKVYERFMEKYPLAFTGMK